MSDPEAVADPQEDRSSDPAASAADRLKALRAGAGAGWPDIQVRYGQALLAGEGCEADPREALRWFITAAHADYPEAVNLLGRCYERGWGTAPDLAMAARCYARAAAAGLDWAMYNYAGALGSGAGVAKDEAAAVIWFQRAAALGHAKSIGILGALTEEGRLIPRDMGEAERLYLIAAEGGDFRSQFHLARRLALQDRHDEAHDWLARAWAGAHNAFRLHMQGELETAHDARVRALANGLPAITPAPAP